MRIAFIVLFAVSLVFSAIFFLFAWIFIAFNKPKLRYIAHIAWHLLTLIEIPLFFIAAAFGLIGTIFLYLPTFVEVALSTPGLKAIVKDQFSANVLDQCLNGDGNLRNLLLNSTNFANTFDEFYNVSYRLNNITSVMDVAPNSPVVTQYKNIYERMKTDLALQTGTDDNSPPTVISSLNTYTQKASPKLKDCSNLVDDIWVSNSTSCLKEYTYTSPSNPTSNVGKSSCLVVLEWSATQTNTRYNGNPKCSSLNVQTQVSNYITSLNNYASNSIAPINNLKSSLDS